MYHVLKYQKFTQESAGINPRGYKHMLVQVKNDYPYHQSPCDCQFGNDKFSNALENLLKHRTKQEKFPVNKKKRSEE